MVRTKDKEDILLSEYLLDERQMAQLGFVDIFFVFTLVSF